MTQTNNVQRKIKKNYIICVDDEKFVLESLISQLKQKFQNNFEYELAESGEEALEVIKNIYDEGNIVSLIITDQLMPGMAGDQFLIEAHKLYPRPIKLLLTGQASLESAVNAINNADLFCYLKKPWDEEGLLLAVEKGLTQYRLLENLENQSEVFRKFVPKQFLKLLLIDNIESIEPELAREVSLTVVFCDIFGYSSISEDLIPHEVFKLLNNYFSKMNPIIENYNGFVDKFLGDGIIALFGGEPEQAVMASIEMLKILKEFNKALISDGKKPIQVGIGVNSGKVILGTLGTKDRIDATVIGDTVNLTSRIQYLNHIYDTNLLITGEVFSKLSNKEKFKIRYIDKVKVKGKSKTTDLYEVYDANLLEEQQIKDLLQEDFRKGIDLYQAKDFLAAQNLFTQCLSKNPNNQLLYLYIQRCENFIMAGCPVGWDGVTIYMEK